MRWLIFLLLVSLTFAETSSLSGITPISENFEDIDCRHEDIAKKVVGDGGCLSVLEYFCINSTSLNFSSLEISAYGRPFSKAISYFESADKKIREAVNKSSDFWYEALENIRLACEEKNETGVAGEIIGYVLVIPPFPAIAYSWMTTCFVDQFLFDSGAKEIISSYRGAMADIAKGENAAFDIIRNEYSELWKIGGGYDYATDAKSGYLKVKDFIDSYNLNKPNTLGSEWRTSSGLSSEITNSWRDGSSSQLCSPAKFVESVSRAFPKIVFLYDNLKSSRERTLSKYEQLELNVSMLKKEVNDRYSGMKIEKLNEVTTYDILPFVEAEEYLVAVSVPSSKMEEINEIINGLGEESGANADYEQGTKVYKEREEFYVARAIEKLSSAQDKFRRAKYEIANTEEYLEYLIDRAKGKVDETKFDAEGAISKGSSNIALLADVIKKKGEADFVLVAIETKKMGEKIKEYKKAYELYKSVVLMLEREYDYNYTRATEANETIKKLEEKVKLAKNDGIDVAFEESQVSELRSLMSQSTAFAENVTKIAEGYISNLYTKAVVQYGYLNSKRLAIFDSLSLLSEIENMEILKAEINGYEKYVVDSAFLPEKTLGQFKKIESSYGGVEKKLSEKRASAFSKYLGKKVKMTRDTGPVFVDEDAEVRTIIEITNDLSFGANESFTVFVPKVVVNERSEISAPQNIKTSRNGGISILFNGVEGKTTYILDIKTPSKIIKVVERTKRRISLDQNELVERISLSLSSSESLSSATYRENLSGICTAYLNGREVSVMENDVLLSGIREEKNDLSVTCRIFSPIELISSNFSSIENSVGYVISVKSNVGYLETVDVKIRLDGNIKSDSIRVFDLSGVPANGFSYSKYGNYYFAKWNIPVLDGNWQVFNVSYELEDQNLYERINELEEEANSEEVNVTQQTSAAKSYLSAGRLSDALREIEKVKKAIDAAKNIKVQKEAVSKKLSDIIDIFSQTKFVNLSYFGLGDVESELNKKVIAFEQKKKEVENLISANKTKEASDVIKELEKIAKTDSIESMIKNKVNKLFDELNKLKNDFFKLSKYFDVTGFVDEITKRERGLVGVGNESSKGNYGVVGEIINETSSAINELKEEKELVKNGIIEKKNGNIKEIENLILDWKREKGNLFEMLVIDEDNPGIRFSIENVSKKIYSLDKEMKKLEENYSSLKSASADYIFENIETLYSMDGKYDELNEGIEGLKELNKKYKLSAESAYSLSKAALSEYAKTAPKEKLSEIEELSGHLGKAKNSYDEGKYLNSLIYSDFVIRKINNTKEKKQFDFGLVVIAAAIVFGVVLVFLFFSRKKKRKELRILKRYK